MSAATGARRRWPWIVAAVVIVIGGAIAGLAYDRLFGRDIPVYASDEAQFKYGSIGNDGAAGVPYPLWVVMPQVCANHLPPGAKGYESFGFLWEARARPHARHAGRLLAREGRRRAHGDQLRALPQRTRARFPLRPSRRFIWAAPATRSTSRAISASCRAARVDKRIQCRQADPRHGQAGRAESWLKSTLPLSAHSVGAQAAQEAGAGLRVELPAPALGTGTHRSVQSRQVQHAPAHR